MTAISNFLISNDALGIVLSFLSYEKLTQVQRVSKQFYWVINNNPHLKAKVLLGEVKHMVQLPRFRFDMLTILKTFIQIAEIDPIETNFREAKTLLKTTVREEKALQGPTKGLTTNSQEFYKLFTELVGLEAKQNLEEAKKTVNLANKIEIIYPGKSMKLFLFMHEAFIKIAKAEAKQDIHSAIATANSIEMTSWRIKTFIEITKEFPSEENLARVKAEVNSIVDKDQFLYEVLKIEVNQNLSNATNTANSITNQIRRDEAFVKIVKVEAKQDIHLAKKTAENSINNLYYKARALIKIAKESPSEENLTNAKAAVDLIIPKNSVSPSKARFKIVKIEVKQNLDNAIQTAGLIRHTLWSGKALFRIVEVEAQQDLLQAAEITRSMKHGSWKAQAYVAMAKACAPKEREENLQEAKNIAYSLNDFPKEQSNAFIAIVKEEAKHSLRNARKTIHSIEASDVKKEVFIGLAKELNTQTNSKK